MTRGAGLRRFLIAAAVGLAVAFVLLLSRGTLRGVPHDQALTDLSDAFMVPGIMMLCAGGMLFVADRGTFDMLRFGVGKVLMLVRGGKHRAEKPKTYYDYMESRRTGRARGYAFLIWTGLAFLLLSLAFAAAFV